jgi:transposase
MYLRTVKVRGQEGSVYEYVRLVESYRENGMNKQRVICNLGRTDHLAPHVDALVKLLTGRPSSQDALRPEDIEPLHAWTWGPMLVARTVWQELGLYTILDQLAGAPNSMGIPLADRALVLVANRLCAPSSEHGLARWLETDYVCDRRGRRWVPCWRPETERLQSRSPRVRVAHRQLKQWYGTLDQLHARKSAIEHALFEHLRRREGLSAELAFYDLTSTYFEGQGPDRLGAHGYSRDGKPRNRQVLLGMVLIEGWPLTHHIFAGNKRDALTVPTVLDDLKQRFGLRRVVFVGDRGMVTTDNLERLRTAQQGYVVGRNRRRNDTVYRYIESATGPWIECPVGRTAQEKAAAPRTLVQEVASEEPGVRIFVVHSDERRAYEQAQRRKAMARVRTALEGLKRRVEQGRLKAPEKIGAAAARILAQHHGHRYYDWRYSEGTFDFFPHSVHLKREKAYEGKYVIQTEESGLTPVEAVQIYKGLSEVERAFRSLKDVLGLRPIYHQTDARVEAHVFVAALAFLLHRALERRLHAAGLDWSATEALETVRTVHVVDIVLGEGRRKRAVTRGSDRAELILKTLGITDRHPPSPPEEEPMIM